LYGAEYKKNFLPVGVRFSRDQAAVGIEKLPTGVEPNRFVWSRGKVGWFSASFGPFRRFTRSESSFSRPGFDNRVNAHLSAFDENVAFLDALAWLQELHYQSLDSSRVPRAATLSKVLNFINEPGFLPNGLVLERVTSDGAVFTDPSGYLTTADELSDGYRSFLSMTLELLRQMSSAYLDRDLFNGDGSQVGLPGVVLIDEVDAHLHPSWQRSIGGWFRRKFPQVQFIVATHSPLICQAAIQGSVFRMPRPGTDDVASMVTGIDLQRLLFGDVLEAYSTELFGQITRSEAGLIRLHRLAELNVKETVAGLTSREAAEQAELRAALPASRDD
jgi:hypothetical protein